MPQDEPEVFIDRVQSHCLNCLQCNLDLFLPMRCRLWTEPLDRDKLSLEANTQVAPCVGVGGVGRVGAFFTQPRRF